MAISKTFFGKIDDNDVFSYKITADDAAFVEILDFGCRLRQIVIPDRYGILANTVLGCDTPQGYFESGNEYFGAVVGRYANRIRNGRYTDSTGTHQLVQNEGRNHIHGGFEGFHNMIWTCANTTDDTITFTATQPDGTAGFPGTLDMVLTYSFKKVDGKYTLAMTLSGKSDKDTLFNPTNHSYFNLNTVQDDVSDHILTIFANEYTPIDDEVMPTGEILPVDGYMDFRSGKSIIGTIKSAYAGDFAEITSKKGIDHNFIIKNDAEKMVKIAILESSESGRKMEIYSNTPGVQLYTGNHLEPIHKGICLEPQYFPDSVNATDNPKLAPYPFLKAGDEATFKVTYDFTITK